MADHAQACRVDFRPSLKVIQCATRVPDILALQALAFGDAVHRLVPLIVAVLETARGVLPLVEAERVKDHGDVAASSQLERVVLAGVRAQSCWAVLTDSELAAVLVVTEYRGMARGRCLRKQNKCRHALTGLDRVRNLLAYDITQIGAFTALGCQGRSCYWHCAQQLQEASSIQSFLGRQVIMMPIAQRHGRRRQAAAKKPQGLPPRDARGVSRHPIHHKLTPPKTSLRLRLWRR